MTMIRDTEIEKLRCDILREDCKHAQRKLIDDFAGGLQQRIAELEAALAECHDALQGEEAHHASSEYEFTTHPLLAKERS